MFLVPIVVLLGIAAYIVFRARTEAHSATEVGRGIAGNNTAPLRAVVTNRRVMLPFAAFIGSIIVTNVVVGAAVEANGPHARGHLASAQSAVPLVFLLGASFWALRNDRRRPLLWAAALVTVIGVSIVVAGNLHVVNTIGAGASAQAETAARTPRPGGIEEGHTLASRGMLITQLGAIAFTVALVLSKRTIGIGTAIWSVALSVLFPPWIVPGAGLVIVAAALVIRASRHEGAVVGASLAS